MKWFEWLVECHIHSTVPPAPPWHPHSANGFYAGVKATGVTHWRQNVKDRHRECRRLTRLRLNPPPSHTEEMQRLLGSCHRNSLWTQTNQALRRTVSTAEGIMGVSLASVLDFFQECHACKASAVVKAPSRRSHRLSELLPSGRRVCSVMKPFTTT